MSFRNGMVELIQSLENKLASKFKSQWPLDKKSRLADYLIDTSGPLTETVEQTEELYLRLYHDAKLKKIGKLIREMD